MSRSEAGLVFLPPFATPQDADHDGRLGISMSVRMRNKDSEEARLYARREVQGAKTLKLLLIIESLLIKR